MSRILFLAIILFVLIMNSPAFAEDPVYIPDTNLKAAIEAELGVTDPNATDMLELLTLNADHYGDVTRKIEDLTGLEHAKNLLALFLYYNNISDISPIGGLTDLYHIRLVLCY